MEQMTEQIKSIIHSLNASQVSIVVDALLSKLKTSRHDSYNVLLGWRT